MGMRGSRRPISTKGEKAYSKHILGELRDETEQHVSDYNAVTNSIKALGKRNFTADEWYSACKQNGLSKVDAEQALDQLFEASAAGVHGAGGAKGGSGTTFRYQDRHLSPRHDAVLQVHLKLWSANSALKTLNLEPNSPVILMC